MTESVPSAIGFVHDNASQVKEEERHQEGPHTEEVSDTRKDGYKYDGMIGTS